MKKLCALLRIEFFSEQDATKIVKFDEGVMRSVAVFLRQCHFQDLPFYISKVRIYVPNIFHCLASPDKIVISCFVKQSQHE